MLYHEPTGSLLLKVDDPLAIRELVPQCRVLPREDYNLAVKCTEDSVRLLRNAGIQAPAPVRFQYGWPGKFTPWEHQRVMAEQYTLHKRIFNLSDMGTGKTNGTLWAADYMMQRGLVRRALILSPLSTIERVWQHDIFDTLMHRVASLVYGSRDERFAALEAAADFYILNHDGITIAGMADAIRKRPDIDLLIVDEGSMFRNADTKKYAALKRLLRDDMRLWWLTATPNPQQPTDAWAQARLVSPHRAPPYFGQFQRQTMQKISTFKWVARADASKHVHDVMQPAIRFKKSDCLDLPPVTYESRQCDLTPEQRQAFHTMRTQMQIESATGDITAVNAADKINKLRQVLCGAIKDPISGEYVTYPHRPRLQLLLDTIAEASAKVLVVVPFKGIVQALEGEVAKHYSVAVLNGDVPARRRDRIINAFKTTADPHVLLCHPQVMSHGLNLVEADTLIFYAPIYSNDQFTQVQERFNRAGQTRKMTIVQMGAHPLEWEIYKVAANRQLSQNNILALYRAVTEGAMH